jgi:hypothetical protein
MITPPVIFFHLPKTGGQTLGAILLRQYPRGTVFELWMQLRETLSAFEALSAEQKRQLRALSGHMPFGYHTQLAPGARYITLLRDPVKRVVSEYWHLRQDPVDWGVWQAPPAALTSLETYVDYVIANHLTNAQTRLLSGYVTTEDRPPLGPMPPDALDRAKANLANHFAVVGITERFDESLLLMKSVLGWKGQVCYTRRNVRAANAQTAPLAEATRARIAEHMREDIELVAFGARIFEEQLRSSGLNLEAPLRKLRRVNAVLTGVRNAVRTPAMMKLRSLPGVRHVWSLSQNVMGRFA